MFIFSYSPFFFMLIISFAVIIMLMLLIFDQVFIVEINRGRIWDLFFEPLVFTLFTLTIFIYTILTIYYWIDINKNDRIEDNDKKKWKKLFFKISLCANAFYYDYKYDRGEPQFFLETFFRKSRDKMCGYVEIPGKTMGSS